MSEALLAYDSFLRACPTKVLVWIIGQVKCQVTVTCTIFSLKMNEKVQKSFDGPMHGFSYMIMPSPRASPSADMLSAPRGFSGPYTLHMTEPRGWERFLAMIGD